MSRRAGHGDRKLSRDSPDGNEGFAHFAAVRPPLFSDPLFLVFVFDFAASLWDVVVDRLILFGLLHNYGLGQSRVDILFLFRGGFRCSLDDGKVSDGSQVLGFGRVFWRLFCRGDRDLFIVHYGGIFLSFGAGQHVAAVGDAAS